MNARPALIAIAALVTAAGHAHAGLAPGSEHDVIVGTFVNTGVGATGSPEDGFLTRDREKSLLHSFLNCRAAGLDLPSMEGGTVVLEEQTNIRLKQGNLIGPSGYISLEDGMVDGFDLAVLLGAWGPCV